MPAAKKHRLTYAASLSSNQIRGFLASFATVSISCIRIACLIPREWFPWKISSSSNTGIIGWILHNPDISPLWTSILIRPFETWDHIREAKAARQLFGADFRGVYQGSHVHLPPLVLAALEPVLDGISEPWQPLLTGMAAHLIDLWIATKFIRIGNYILNELRDPWEDDLQPRIPATLRAPAEHIFALSNQEILYTNQLPAHKISESIESKNNAESDKEDGSNSRERSDEPSNGDAANLEVLTPAFSFSDLPLLAAQTYYYSPITALASGLGSTHRCFQNLWLLLLLQSLQQGCQGPSSISTMAFWLSLASYMELHYFVFLIPLSLCLLRRSEQGNGANKNQVYGTNSTEF